MRRRKIDLSKYGLIQKYQVPLGKWRLLVYWLPAIFVAYFGWHLYIMLHLRFYPVYRAVPGPEFMPYILLFAIMLLLFITLIWRPGRVIAFQEGIYVHPGLWAARDPARFPTFIPWSELRQIVRTPYRTMRMSIVGIKPTHEVILPDNLHKQFDEIQDQILHMQTRGKVEIIDLEDITNYSLAEYGSPLQDIYGLSPGIVIFLPLLRAFIRDIRFVHSKLDFLSSYGDVTWLALIPVISGIAILIVIGVMVRFFRLGWFKSRLIVYRRGLLRIAQGMGAFTRWEELLSIEKVKPGVYKLQPVDERVKPYDMNIGKAHDTEFERILNRLGKLAG